MQADEAGAAEAGADYEGNLGFEAVKFFLEEFFHQVIRSVINDSFVVTGSSRMSYAAWTTRSASAGSRV